MQLMNITSIKKYTLGILCTLASMANGDAQENSPYSHYGLGNLISNQNTVNKAMGGISTAYYDYQSINFTNPASYSNLNIVTYDMGVEINSRTISNLSKKEHYTANNFMPAYLQLGVPLRKNWGMVFGLKPVTNIQYNISTSTRLPGSDSLQTIYEGNGGLNEAYMGMGYKIKGFSFGENWGYAFGNSNINTKRIIINDTVAYQSARYADETFFSNFFYNIGIQYEHALKNNLLLCVGASGSGEQKLHATRNIIRESFQHSSVYGDIPIDTIYIKNAELGNVVNPLTYNIGFMLAKLTQDRNNNRVPQWKLGMEYSSTQWSRYRFYDTKDPVNDSWMWRVGGELIPNALSTKSYWGSISYRAGFYYGKDYINTSGPMKTYAFTAGLSFPIRRWNSYSYQFTQLNTAFEIGKRGNNENIISENFFKFTLGICLSDIWFKRYKYN